MSKKFIKITIIFLLISSFLIGGYINGKFVINKAFAGSDLYLRLYYAMQNDEMAEFKSLLKKSSGVINEDNGDLLRCAIGLEKEPVIIKLILDAGCNPNLKETNYQNTALHLAVDACNGENNATILQYVKLLIAKGADVNIKRAYDEYTPLHIAARNENIDKEIFALLLTPKNVDVNIRCNKINDSEDGAWQALFYIATRMQDFKNSSKDIATMLIGKGADLSELTTSDDAARRKGWNVLHLLCGTENDHLGVAEVLVGAGIPLESRTLDEGLTPLHIACQTNNPKICQFLLEKGADYNSRDIEGVSVLEHARGFCKDKNYESADVLINWAQSH